MNFRPCALALTALLSLCSFGAQFKLTENGSPACCIILQENAGLAENHAARELAKYLGIISGGAAPLIVTAPQPGLYPVRLLIGEDAELGDQGYRMKADKDALVISAQKECGILFGVYELLKRHGGIRWLIPGKDGEYFTVKPTISVDSCNQVQKPDFAFRYYTAVSSQWNSPLWDTWDWCLRNSVRVEAAMGVLRSSQQLNEGLLERGVFTQNGGHVFSYLLTGRMVEDFKDIGYTKHVDNLFAQHPEYFALIDGKRVISYHGGAEPQPCTSNPEVVQRFAKHLVLEQKNRAMPDSTFWFMNNDTTRWCQCDNCRKQDPPEEQKAGIVSTRYWTLANAVMDLAKKEMPNIRITGVTYQNFSLPPVGIKPDKRFYNVMLSNHRRCWKHALDDANCPTNKWYLNYNKGWNDTGIPLFTYEMLSRTGNCFMPNEKSWIDTLKFYRKNLKNIQGMKTEMSCPDGIFNGPNKTFAAYNNWYMMWQSMYLAAAFQWNLSSDYDGIYEEINSLFYGKGWAGGMKEFRRLLTEAYFDSPGCWGYGHSVMTGKFLDRPGLHKQLLASLDAAEKAAALDPDPRALAHVKRDRDYFARTWEKSFEEYQSNFREIRAYPCREKINLDGVLNDADWKNADVVTRFKEENGSLAEKQTGVKLCYDSENIYLGLELEEPEFDNMVANVKEHDGPLWDDSTIELFINPPIMGGTYYQLIFNKYGVLYDGIMTPGSKGPDKAFESNAEFKMTHNAEHCYAEIRIPVRPILGSVLQHGEVIKMNVMRIRKLNTGKSYSLSTWSTGTPHNVETFHPVTFAEERAVTPGNRSEVDSRPWKNGSFNEKAKKEKIPSHWKINGDQVPASWNFASAASAGGEMDYLPISENSDNYYIRLKKGFIFQFHNIPNDKIRVTLRVKGKSKVKFWIFRYTTGVRKGLSNVVVKEMDIDSPDWKYETFEFNRPSPDLTEEHAFAIIPQSGEVEIDEIYLVGQ